MPRFLTRSSVKKIDRFFFAAPLIQTEMDQIRAERLAKAETSEDPTAKSAIEIISNIPSLAGYDKLEVWFQAIENTWIRYTPDTCVGRVMNRRYKLKESSATTCINLAISEGTYFSYRYEFLEYTAFFLALGGVMPNFVEPYKI